MAAAHKWCSLVFVHKIDGILKIQCKIKTKEGRWNVLFHYEPRFTDSGDRVILSEKLEDNQAAAEWGRKQAELIKKGEEITKRLNEKYKPILLARRVQKDANK